MPTYSQGRVRNALRPARCPWAPRHGLHGAGSAPSSVNVEAAGLQASMADGHRSAGIGGGQLASIRPARQPAGPAGYHPRPFSSISAGRCRQCAYQASGSRSRRAAGGPGPAPRWHAGAGERRRWRVRGAADTPGRAKEGTCDADWQQASLKAARWRSPCTSARW